MLVDKIYISSINSFRKEQAVGLPSGIIGIVGANGAGKTTMVESIMGALYGQMPFRKGKVLNRINKREQKAEMGLEFRYGGHSYKAVRKIAPASQKAFLYVKSGDEWQSLVSKGSPKDFASKIEAMIGPYETMLSSVFCAQNNASDLLSADATERKRVFRDLLGIGDLEKKSGICGAMKNDLRGKMAAAEAHYIKLKEEAGRKDSLVEQLWAVRKRMRDSVKT